MLAGHILHFGSFGNRRVSRSAAFQAQGVTLKYMASSWSGVRADDGMVVFAISADQVLVDPEGSRCLLWRPAELGDARAQRERLQHCELALVHGRAEALLAYGDAGQMDAGVVLAIRVVALGGQYWARWNSRARLQASAGHGPRLAPHYACAVAHA